MLYSPEEEGHAEKGGGGGQGWARRGVTFILSFFGRVLHALWLLGSGFLWRVTCKHFGLGCFGDTGGRAGTAGGPLEAGVLGQERGHMSSGRTTEARSTGLLCIAGQTDQTHSDVQHGCLCVSAPGERVAAAVGGHGMRDKLSRVETSPLLSS